MTRTISHYFNKHILKTAFTILFLGLYSRSEAQECSYTLSMHDSYGDGWNGGYLSVYINDFPLGNFSAANYGSTGTFLVNTGDLVELIYTPGAYEEENSYQLFDPVWNLLFGDGPNPQTGNVFSSAGDCDGAMLPGNHPCTAIYDF